MKYALPGIRIHALLAGLLFLLLSHAPLRAQTTMTVMPETLAVHSGPSMQDPVVTELTRGQKVTVDEVSGNWAAISFWGRKGYVPYRLLRSVETPSAAAPAAVTPAKKEQQVLVCKSGNAYAYHAYTCHGLARCTHTVEKVAVSEARRMGYVPCKICY